MKYYTLGFLVNTDFTKVVLIKKNTQDPEQAWQNGLLNGVGGKYEDKDKNMLNCMVREFYEEAGIKPGGWHKAGWITDNQNYLVQSYISVCPDAVLESAKTMECEIVGVYYLPLVLSGWYNLANDCKELLQMSIYAFQKKRQFQIITK